MADKQIIQLTAGTPVAADVIEFQVVAGGAGSSKKATFTQVQTLVSQSPSLVTPNLGTPSAGNLLNCTGFPVGGLTGTGTGVLTFLATPSSANLAAVVTDETGSGSLVFSTNPVLVTPNLGVPSAIDLSNATMLSLPARVVSGTTDTIVATDRGAEVIYTTGSSCAVTLGNAVSFFGDGFNFWAKNAGAGTVTIVPTTATIDGSGSFVLPAGMSGKIVSKGGAYYVNYGKQGGGGGGSPGGANGEVQFNNSGSFGGDSGFTYNSSTDTAFLGSLNISKTVTVSTSTANTPLWSGSGFSATGSSTASAFSLAGTLNTSGDAEFFKISCTTTASGADGKIFTFDGGSAGTTSVFNYDLGQEAFLFGNTLVEADFFVGYRAQGGGHGLSCGFGNPDSLFISDLGFHCKGDLSFGFTGASLGGTPIDTTFTRAAAGRFQINNPNAGTIGELVLKNLIANDANGAYIQTPGMTVANLPASPVRGMRCYVTNSNAASFTAGIGAVVAGGGSTVVPVFYDGTNWRIG